MGKVKRYDMHAGIPDWEPTVTTTESADGEWVYYSDHEIEIKRLRSALEAVKIRLFESQRKDRYIPGMIAIIDDALSDHPVPTKEDHHA